MDELLVLELFGRGDWEATAAALYGEIFLWGVISISKSDVLVFVDVDEEYDEEYDEYDVEDGWEETGEEIVEGDVILFGEYDDVEVGVGGAKGNVE